MTSVLLVDDDPRMLVLGRKVLERQGYHVVVAANGSEAAAAVDDGPIDVVLMDLEMPRVDGRQAMKLIKARHPDLPIVAVTAYAMVGDSERYREEGFDEYISKPYEIGQLRSLVARLANRA
jgi:CheY-like chemotaxis protein